CCAIAAPKRLGLSLVASSRSERRTPPAGAASRGRVALVASFSAEALGLERVSIALNHEPASSPAVRATPNAKAQSNNNRGWPVTHPATTCAKGRLLQADRNSALVTRRMPVRLAVSHRPPPPPPISFPPPPLAPTSFP